MQTDNIATQINSQKGTLEQSRDNVTNITPYSENKLIN